MVENKNIEKIKYRYFQSVKEAPTKKQKKFQNKPISAFLLQKVRNREKLKALA
jgi:uncharacterized protein YlaI